MSGQAGGAAGVAAAGPAGAILAGGRALRFGGRPKGLELVGGSRIIDRALAALSEVASEVLLVGASAAVAATLPHLRRVPDEAPGAGPLGGILSALRATGRDTVVVAWDMPFLAAADLRALLGHGDDVDAVVWEHDGHVEPLCALYRPSAVEPLEGAFRDGERSPREALRRLRVHVLSRAPGEPASAFASVNSAAQLEEARAREVHHS